MSILQYLKKPANEGARDLPEPGNVAGIPASIVLAANHSVESMLRKRHRSHYNHYSYISIQAGHWQVLETQQLLESTVKS